MPYIIALLIFASFQLQAHPVIFKGGTVVSSQNMEMFGDQQINYSFHQNWAAGVNLWRFRRENGEQARFNLLRLNHLAKRWNNDDSQANIYLSTAVGEAQGNFNSEARKSAYMGGIEADWENRTLYTSFKYNYFSSPSVAEVSMTQTRVGYSPYEANFDQLQTWVMLQGMYMGEVERSLTLTPLLRFFHHNVLWEVGSSLRGEWFLNFMVHL